ncbi:MAG: glycosyltransferase family 2 protein [Sandaracinaceae bacterium]|nr:glycosyltransferase family 2 protein [Sandaracinaceae bacterium]
MMDRVLPVHSRRRAPYVSASRLIGRLLGAGREPETEPPPIAPASAPRIGARAAHPIAPADQAAKASLQVTHPRIVRIARRPLEERISVVIPTKNGEAEGLNDTLRALRHQRGAGDVEIVVVDSGSTDATLEIAGDWGATIVEIPPAEFNHGGTRNFGFDLAKGDLVAFTVQDAILGADDALYELAKLVVDDPQVAVASVRQVPRATADLFACWQHHSLFAGLGVQTRKGRVDPLRLRHLPGGERWRLGYVDDVFAIHRREVFESLRYRTIEHAEDAEYGQRVLESGRAVAFLGTRAVIHSHDRSDRYHLKNYYVSRMVMGPMLGDVDPTRWDKTRIGSFAELVEGARAVYAGLNGLAASIELEREHDLAAFRESLGVLLAHPAAGVAEAPAGSELAAVMDALGEVAGSGAADREAPDPSKFRLVYEWNVDNLLWPYLSTRYRKLDGMDLVQVLYKMFGCTLGADLANYVLAPPVATDAGALDRAIRAAIAEVGRG